MWFKSSRWNEAHISNFPPIFKNIDDCRNDIGEYMKKYAEENDLLKNAQQMLISSFKWENGTNSTPLLNFYLSLGLQCTKIYRCVEYTPRKCFNNFVQSVVDARREGDENSHSGVVAETMKLLDNSSYGYQIMDRSRHTITKYLGEEKTHKAKNEIFFSEWMLWKKKFIWSRTVKVSNWTYKTIYYRLFHSSIR